MRALFITFKFGCMGIGFAVVVLHALGSVGIGNFVLSYGPKTKTITCTKG